MGRMRLKVHKRWATRTYNPPLAGHCAYQEVLRAAGMDARLGKVEWLRLRVADLVEDACLKNERIAGLAVRHVVADSGVCLRAYLAATRWDMWASQVEVACVAKVCNVHMLVNLLEGIVEVVGEKHLALKYVLKYSMNHFTLAKLRGKRDMRKHATTCMRAGMQMAWTWDQGENPPASSTQLPAGVLHDEQSDGAAGDHTQHDALYPQDIVVDLTGLHLHGL